VHEVASAVKDKKVQLDRDIDASLLMALVNDKSARFLCMTLSDATRDRRMGTARRRYGLAGFQCVQLYLPDAEGKLLDEDGYDAAWFQNQVL
jgi:hypothetical protein